MDPTGQLGGGGGGVQTPGPPRPATPLFTPSVTFVSISARCQEVKANVQGHLAPGEGGTLWVLSSF